MNWKLSGICALVAMVLLTVIPQAGLAQDTSADVFTNDDRWNKGFASSQINKGSKDSEVGMSGSYSWSETYYLESYMNMYEATGDLFWLDKVTDHSDRMVSNAFDHNSDGHKGWADSRYSHNQTKNGAFSFAGAAPYSSQLLENGSFEVDVNLADNIPDGWTLQGASSKVYRSATAGVSGTAGVVIESDGTNQNRIIQTIPYSAGKTYTVEVMASVETEKTTASIDIYDVNNNRILYSVADQIYVERGTGVRAHHVGFEKYVFSFIAPPSGNTIQLRLGLQDYSAVGYKATFDQASVKVVEHNLLNGGMEQLSNGGDQTLPLHWKRWANSDLSNIMLSSDSHSGAHSLKIVTDNTSWEKAEQEIDYIPNATYSLSYWGKIYDPGATGAQGRIIVYNQTDDTTLAAGNFSSSSWAAGAPLNFTAPSAPGATLKVQVYQTIPLTTGFTVFVDDIALSPGTLPSEVVLNGAFQTVSGSDPISWTRMTGSSTTDVYVTPLIDSDRDLAIRNHTTIEKGIEQTISYSPLQKYFVSYMGLASNSDVNGIVEIYDATNNSVVASQAFNSAAWLKRTFSFVAPSLSGLTLKIRLRLPASDTPSTHYLDNVSIKPLIGTEAAGWERTSGGYHQAQRINDTTIFDDSWGLELSHDGNQAPMMSQKLHNYSPSSKYGILFYAKAATGTTGQVRIYDHTTSTVLESIAITNSDSLAMHKFDFVTPTAGHNLSLDIFIPSGSNGDTLWVDSFHTAQYWEQLVDEANIATSMLRFVNVVLDNSTLHAAYLTKAESYRDFIADNLVMKWDYTWNQITGVDGSNNGTGVYSFPAGFSNDTASTRSLPHNQYLSFARMLYMLYDATEDTSYDNLRGKYMSRANDMVRAFKGTLVVHPMNSNAYNWLYWQALGAWDEGHFSSLVYLGEDTAHSAFTAMGVLEAYRHGQVFTPAEIQTFTNTMKQFMWNGSTTNPIVSTQTFLAPGSGADAINRTNSGLINHWAKFAEIDYGIHDMTRAICEIRQSCAHEVASDTSRFTRNKAINSDFNILDPSDSTLPKFWSRFNTTDPTQAYFDSTDKSVVIKTNGSSWRVLEMPILNYEPNSLYEMVYTAKRVGSVNGRVELYDNTTNTVLGHEFFSDTMWKTRKFRTTVKTPVAAGHDIRLRLYTQSYTPANQEVRFDNVYAYPINTNSQVPNPGFEVSHNGDSTLPLYWGRMGVQENVVLDSSTGNYDQGVRAVKLVSAATSSAQELYYDWVGYKSGGAYNIELRAKVTGTAGGVVKVLKGATVLTTVTIPSSASGWTTFTGSFIAPAYTTIENQEQLKVIVTHNIPTAAGTLWIDELGIRSSYTYPY